MDVINGTKAIIKIPVMENGEYATLTTDDEIYYSLFDVEGHIVDSLENIEVDVSELNDPSEIVIEIPASTNLLSENDELSQRILIVNYTLKGALNNFRTSYRVIPFRAYTCNKYDVRTCLGVPDTVLEDSMIDIYSAYLKSKSLFDDNVFDQALSSTGIKNVYANRIIVIESALTFKNSLMLMTPKIESDSVVSQTRFTMSKEDFDQLFSDLEDELQGLIAEINDEDIEGIYDPDMFVIGNLTDTFTGA